MISPSAVAVLAVLWLASLAFGTGPLDYAALNALSVTNHPELTGAVTLVTALGGWEVLAIVTAISAALMALQRRFAAAALLLAITLSGRVFVEVQKWAFGRSRPEEPLRLMEIDSFAFPSGHAANSTITYLTVTVLLVAAGRRRQFGVTAALALSLAVGASRIALGVHWPSDVVAGWCFGLLWTGAAFSIARRTGRSERQSAANVRNELNADINTGSE